MNFPCILLNSSSILADFIPHADCLYISVTDTLEHYAEFHTLPKDPSNVRLVLTHRGRINTTCPHEENLWNVLESSLLDYSEGDVNEKSEYRGGREVGREREGGGGREREGGGGGIDEFPQNNLDTHSHARPGNYNYDYDYDSDNITSDQMRSLAIGAQSSQRHSNIDMGGDNGTPNAPGRTKSPIHFMIHCGDILSMESIVQVRSTILLDLLLDPASSPHTWKKGTRCKC